MTTHDENTAAAASVYAHECGKMRQQLTDLESKLANSEAQCRRHEKLVKKLEEQIRRVRKASNGIKDDIREGDKVLCHVGTIDHACAVALPLWKEAAPFDAADMLLQTASTQDDEKED